MSRGVMLSLLLAFLSALAAAQLRGLPPPAELAGQIEKALHEDPVLTGSHILVRVEEARILLSGTVMNRKQQTAADRIAKSFAVNRTVINKLVVQDERRPGR